MESQDTLKTKKTDILSIDPRNIYEQEGFNVRQDMGDLEALALSIAKVGQQVPLKVVKDRGTERYRVIDGHRRMRAIRLAIEKGFNIPYVKSELFNGNGEDELFTMIVTGTGQKALNAVEQGEGLKRLVDLGYKPEELSDKIAKSIPHVYALLKIANMSKRVKDCIVSGEISASTVLTIVKHVDNEAEVFTLVKRAVAKATNDGEKNKKATAKHVEGLKPLSDKDKLSRVYQHFLDGGEQGLVVDLLEIVLHKTKELSVEEIITELETAKGN